jgi:DNA-binding beta-propeller fold protein YncE
MANDIFKSGDFSFKIDMDWARLPGDWSFFEVVDVDIDSKDRVFVFCRGAHPVIVFDAGGNFLNAWGEGFFDNPHGITIGPDDGVWCVDNVGQTVQKFTPDGRLLLTLGNRGRASGYMSGEPFNLPTKVAIDRESGAVYVADGYNNARVHKYTADGEHLFSWGRSGPARGEFNIVHSVCTDKNGWVYVADRESHRIQVFDEKGHYITQWNDLHRPCGFYITRGEPQLAIIAQIPSHLELNIRAPNLGACVTIHDMEGRRLAYLGDSMSGREKATQFLAPHGVVMDSGGNIYVGEVSYAHYRESSAPPPWTKPCFRKLVRI